MTQRRHLHLVPGGAGPDGQSGPPAPPDTTPPDSTPVTEDGVELEARVLLARLSRWIIAVQTPDRPLPQDSGVAIAVFNADAIPELSGLLLQNRYRRQALDDEDET